MKQFETLNQMWEHSISTYPQNTLLAIREHDLEEEEASGREAFHYRHYSYTAIDEKIIYLGSALAYIGLRELDTVAVIAEESMGWLIADFAILGNRASTVPLGTDFTTEEMNEILHTVDCKVVFVDTEKTLKKYRNIIDAIPAIHAVIVLSEDFASADQNEKKMVFAFEHLLQIGEDCKQSHVFHQRRTITKPDDIATYLFSSGTTGDLKGIPLTHSNIMFHVNQLPGLISITAEDRLTSILSIWDSFSRVLEYAAIRSGASIWHGEQEHILRDIKDIAPTFLASVPRFWVGLYDYINNSLKSKGKASRFNDLFLSSQKILHYQKDKSASAPTFKDKLKHLLAEILFYGRYRRRFGKSFKAAICGGGHLPAYIDDFFEILRINLLEEYGTAETSPLISMRTSHRKASYTVGMPMPGTKVKIFDRRKGEKPANTKGEIHVAGPHLFDGYYRNQELDKRFLYTDDSGTRWFKTGDIGYKTDNDDLVVIGRASCQLILDTGAILSPEPLESALLRSPLIEQVCLFAHRSEIHALVVPNWKILEKECQKQNITLDKEATLPSEELKTLLDIRLATLLAMADFSEYEISKYAFTKPFTTSDRTMTHTYNIRRHAIFVRDASLIGKLAQQ